jgi:hypothetical protein
MNQRKTVMEAIQANEGFALGWFRFDPESKTLQSELRRVDAEGRIYGAMRANTEQRRRNLYNW